MSAAIYTVLDSLLLRPLPYAHGDRFVSLLGSTLHDPSGMQSVTVQDALAYRQMRSFDVFGWMRFANFNLTAPGVPQYLSAVQVTPSLANGVGVNPRLGRWFRENGYETEAVLSHGL